MKRPLAYITAPWSNSQYENAGNAAAYCRQVYKRKDLCAVYQWAEDH